MPAPLILIIEDDSHIGGLVSEVLREASYRVELVANIEAARANAASALRPNAIISDLLVAGSGPPADVANQIDALFPGTPLTLMTGVPRNRRTQMGVTHPRILEKPFELDELLSVVREMLALRANSARR